MGGSVCVTFEGAVAALRHAVREIVEDDKDIVGYRLSTMLYEGAEVV